MTTTLNATTSNGLVVTPDNSGNIVLQYNGVAAPAFSAYSSNGQVISNATYTKIQCNTEEFDTASCYDNSTNYRFTPTVAGYYQVNGQVYAPTSSTRTFVILYKNGSQFKRGSDITSSVNSVVVSTLIYMNGTTDYLEMWFWQQSGGNLTLGTNQNDNYFQACLLRGA